MMLDTNIWKPGREPGLRTNRLKALLQRQTPGAARGSSLGRGVTGHGEACRSNSGRGGRNRRASVETKGGECRSRDARPAMLLPAIAVRRLSTRLSFSKSVPCNIIVLATGGSRWLII
ncbi:hypothetical protein ACVILK_007847 [Bradyrhizobium embrapense]